MRKAVRAIIIKDGKLLVMHRNKFGSKYNTLPGGNVEMHETPDEALVREVTEETSVSFQNPRLVFLEHAGQPYGDQYIYLCDYVSGEPKLDPNSEEAHINKLGQNLHEPSWVSLKKLAETDFVSPTLLRHILAAADSGWAENVLEFNS